MIAHERGDLRILQIKCTCHRVQWWHKYGHWVTCANSLTAKCQGCSQALKTLNSRRVSIILTDSFVYERTKGFHYIPNAMTLNSC